MNRRQLGAALGLALALGAIWAPMAASGASANTTIHGTFDANTGLGTFDVASGPLNDVCSAGTTSDEARVVKETAQGLKLVVLKTFYCDEGPTLVMKLSVLVDFEPTFSINFSWNVVAGSGTDGLESLRGAGTGFGDDQGDHYSGRMSLR
jgi:hypothetical protein